MTHLEKVEVVWRLTKAAKVMSLDHHEINTKLLNVVSEQLVSPPELRVAFVHKNKDLAEEKSDKCALLKTIRPCLGKSGDFDATSTSVQQGYWYAQVSAADLQAPLFHGRAGGIALCKDLIDVCGKDDKFDMDDEEVRFSADIQTCARFLLCLVKMDLHRETTSEFAPMAPFEDKKVDRLQTRILSAIGSNVWWLKKYNNYTRGLRRQSPRRVAW